MGIYEKFKDVVKIVKDIDNIELYKEILEIQSEMNLLYEEKQENTERIKELEDVLKISKKLSFEYPFYYLKDDKVPFCPRCWEADQKAIHLLGTENESQFCPECSNKYILDRNNGKVRNIRKMV